MDKNNLTHDLKKQLEDFENLVQTQLPEHAAMKLEDKYNQSFEQEYNAFEPSGKWASRKSAKNRDTERGQGTLVQSGALKASAQTDIQPLSPLLCRCGQRYSQRID